MRILSSRYLRKQKSIFEDMWANAREGYHVLNYRGMSLVFFIQIQIINPIEKGHNSESSITTNGTHS